MHWEIKKNQQSSHFCNILRLLKHFRKTHSSITLCYNCIQVHEQFDSLTKPPCAKSQSPNIRMYNLFSSGLISFRMHWLDLLAVQRTLKSLLQHHGSKASIIWCSALFIVQLSHPYMTTGKPQLWLDGHLLAMYCLCFLICCLGWS